MIVTGEASGDLHGANLVRALRKQAPSLLFFGMGGDELARAGVELLFSAARISVVGLMEVFSHLGDILAAKRALTRALRERHPDLLILIDFPDFNLIIAKQARKLDIPVFYYISPQVWAWRSGRVQKIARLSERIGVILPFEKDFYARQGVHVDFVGHPLMDAVQTSGESDRYRIELGLAPGTRLVGLLPGSRTREIGAMLPVFLEAARLIAGTITAGTAFVIPSASTVAEEHIREIAAPFREELDVRILSENRYDLMAACDAVVAASGTVTLELAILGVPTVTCYRVSPRTYFLGRLLVRGLEWFSLVNLIAGRAVIPELLQNEVNPERIAEELTPLLTDKERRGEMIAGLAEVRKKLGAPGASDRAATVALEVLHGKENAA